MAITPMEIYKLLPKTNCKKCGEQTCMSFAFKLLNREKKLEDCKPLFEEEKYARQREKLIEYLKPLEELCIGCGNCVVVCPVHVENDPYGCGSGLAPRTDKLILKVENGVVHVLNMDMCRRYGKNRVLCVVCRENCPTDAISFLEG